MCPQNCFIGAIEGELTSLTDIDILGDTITPQ